MTYEEYLDEVTTLITEIYDVSDEAAVKYVMRAQAADFFTLHDEHESMRSQQQAEQDARTVYEQQRPAVAPIAPKPHSRKGPVKH